MKAIQVDQAKIVSIRTSRARSAAIDAITMLESSVPQTEIKHKYGVETVGCVISSHCAPGTLGGIVGSLELETAIVRRFIATN